MIDCYTWPTPNGHKVHIMLEETGLEWNVHPINIQENYARKLVTVISGGVFDLLDPVLERHSFDDVGEMA